MSSRRTRWISRVSPVHTCSHNTVTCGHVDKCALTSTALCWWCAVLTLILPPPSRRHAMVGRGRPCARHVSRAVSSCSRAVTSLEVLEISCRYV